MSEDGVDMALVQKIVGHTRLAQTVEYRSVTDKEKRDSKRGLNEVINTSMKKRRTKQDAPSKESNLVNYSDSD